MKRISKLSKEDFYKLALKVLQENYEEANIKLYTGIIQFPEYYDDVTEQVIVRAKNSKEALDKITENRLPELSLDKFNSEEPYGRYGVIEIKQYKKDLKFTTEDVEEILEFVFKNHFREHGNEGNEHEVLSKLQFKYALKLTKLMQLFRNNDKRRNKNNLK